MPLQVIHTRTGSANRLPILPSAVLVHRYLPAGRRTLRQIMPGVLVTVLLSLAYGIAFAAYLGRMGQTYVKTYAGLASVMVALVFLYAVAFTFIYGGEVNAVLADRDKSRDSDFTPGDDPSLRGA